ncbi:lipase, gdsl [Grosmannia clavigera kw1407]|uniref:Lipase, gdsl n=1 Tax=Grosmannia clavigera (strain kw1407 / UAMH 11150) TaxID=655863 RepID=F0XSC4_GROCL|nr:lipase, gdsl [Grosmannia clavigera kw1407]EFW99448.1 lipase, gdsl [Grosmannia clavigera kw1407]
MAERPLRILCLGDSLTAGYTQAGLLFHPYHHALVRKLKAAFPDLEVDVVEDGLSGDVSSHFSARLTAAFRAKKMMRPFDWTIVLGGTNDLCSGASPEQTFENLERAWSNGILRRSKVLALTVPEMATTSSSPVVASINARRDRLNALVQGYTHEDYYSYDFKSAFSYTAMSEEDRKRYWDDTLHFTPAGYDLMGDKIGAALVDILHREADAREQDQLLNNGVEQGRQRLRRKRKFKGDENSFEEESGSPGDLRRGYVVVRCKDLD